MGAIGDVAVVKGQSQAAKVRAATHATDDDVRLYASHLQLLKSLLPDDRLMQQDVVQHATQSIVGRLAGESHLDRLADGHPQATGIVLLVGEHGTARGGLIAGAGGDGGTKHMHQGATAGLLLVADAHHEHLALDIEKVARHRQSAAPLACTGLCSQGLDALCLVVKGLGHGCIWLVAAGRAGAFILEKDLGRCFQGSFQPNRTHQWRGPP